LDYINNFFVFWMEEESDPPPGVMTALTEVTVTLMNGDEQKFECSVETPVVGQGALHRDHSGDNASQSDDSLKELSTPPPDTKALDATKARKKRKHFRKLCLF
jgi:hypothetical protein